MGPSAKSLILDLLSTLRRGAAPVRALVEAADLFGISQNSLRVALARLHASGLVERDERGHYRVGNQAAPVNRRVTSWHRLESRLRRWDGHWIGVHTAGLSRGRRSGERLRARALEFLGFRALAPDLEIRPDNLKGGVEPVREELHALGLENDALVFTLRELDPDVDARARTLWDVDALTATYHEMIGALDASAARLATMEPGRARAEAFRLGGRAIRALAYDPLLPEPLLAGAPRAALFEATRRYDRLGRSLWRGWLGDAQATSESTPADVAGWAALPMSGS